jgi:hypothetical protein
VKSSHWLSVPLKSYHWLSTNENSSKEQTTNDNPSKEHDHQRSKDIIEQKDINAMLLEIFRSVN